MGNDLENQYSSNQLKYVNKKVLALCVYYNSDNDDLVLSVV